MLIKFSRYHISKTHGFFPKKEPLRWIPSLSKHISLIKRFPEFKWEEVYSLPEFSEISTLNYEEKELAYLVHLVINSMFYSSECPQNRIIPKNLGWPTIKLSKILDRPPIVNLASLGFYNWRYLNPIKVFHPDNIECIFSFSHHRDESNFYHYESYIEIIGAVAMNNLLTLHETFESKPIDKALLTETQKNIAKIRQALEMMYEKVDPEIFYNTFRHQLKSFENVTFEGPNAHFKHLQGSSAVQSPLIKLFDSVIGIDHKNQFLTNTDAYLKKPHRDLLSYLRKKDKSKLKDYIVKNKVVDEWNEMINEFYQFRMDHKRLTDKYIGAPSKGNDSTGTGGSMLHDFLTQISNNTKQQLI